MREECIFCHITTGKIPAHRIWEDDKHLAFLSIFPNTDGFSVVIPKEHYESNFAICPREVVSALTATAQLVSAKICRAFADDVGRCALVYEGYGVNHLHAKLIPLHGTAQHDWRPRASHSDKFFKVYEGYITTQEPSEPATSETLAALAAKIKSA